MTVKNYIKSYKFKKGRVILNLSVKDIPLTMDAFPNSRKVLRKHLPTIFKSKCFNSENLSFYKESKKTEIAHLFEHMLLEYMCMAKIEYANEVSYSGRTTWNKGRLTGKFKVEIECSLGDFPIFMKALEKSVTLLDSILFTNLKLIRRDSLRMQTVPTLRRIS